MNPYACEPPSEMAASVGNNAYSPSQAIYSGNHAEPYAPPDPNYMQGAYSPVTNFHAYSPTPGGVDVDGDHGGTDLTANLLTPAGDNNNAWSKSEWDDDDDDDRAGACAEFIVGNDQVPKFAAAKKTRGHEQPTASTIPAHKAEDTTKFKFTASKELVTGPVNVVWQGEKGAPLQRSDNGAALALVVEAY